MLIYYMQLWDTLDQQLIKSQNFQHKMAFAGKWGLLKFTFGTLGNETKAESTLLMKNILTYFVYNFQKTATISSLHREALKEKEKKKHTKREFLRLNWNFHAGWWQGGTSYGYFLKHDNFKLNYRYSQNIHINIIQRWQFQQYLSCKWLHKR